MTLVVAQPRLKRQQSG